MVVIVRRRVRCDPRTQDRDSHSEQPNSPADAQTKPCIESPKDDVPKE
jgi:hypothetical protein